MIRAILSILTIIGGIVWEFPFVAVLIVILFIIQEESLEKII